MLWRIRNFFYYQLKDIVECHHQRWYHLKHQFEIFIMLIFAIRMIITFISIYTNIELFIHYHHIEPLFRYSIYKNSMLYRHYLMAVFMLAIFGILGRIIFLLSSIKIKKIFWSSYQLIVINIQQYNQCCLNRSEMKKIFDENYEINIHSFELVRKFLPTLLFQPICWLWTRLSISIHKIDFQLNIKKWQHIKPLGIKQYIGLDDRLEIIRIMYKADLIVFYMQILFCKLL